MSIIKMVLDVMNTHIKDEIICDYGLVALSCLIKDSGKQ